MSKARKEMGLMVVVMVMGLMMVVVMVGQYMRWV